MKKIIFLLLVPLILYACDKGQTILSQTDLNKICFKGRYVGDDCYYSVIQILGPSVALEKFNGSHWGKRDTIFSNAVGAISLLNRYKDGKPFLFHY